PSFFFSSRRRHTRCYRDWSSDVCSSDLGMARKRPCTDSLPCAHAPPQRLIEPEYQTRPATHKSAVSSCPSTSVAAPSFSFRDQLAHFKNRDHGQEADKQKQQRQEQAHRANKNGPVPPRGGVHAPGGGQKVAVQAGDDDHKALKPHPQEI